MGARRITALLLAVPGLASLAGCATQLAWPPEVRRLPEGEVVRAPAQPPAAKPVPVTFDEMLEMARAGTPSEVIIQKLRDSRLVYAVTPEQARALAARGLPADVIAYLEHGEAAVAPRAVAPLNAYPHAYPYYAYPYAQPYWGYPYGPRYPGATLYFGFGRRW
jgi:hypothetical protein